MSAIRYRFGFEAKRGDTPKITKSMRVGLADLRLDHLWIVHPGARSFVLVERDERHEGIDAWPHAAAYRILF